MEYQNQKSENVHEPSVQSSLVNNAGIQIPKTTTGCIRDTSHVELNLSKEIYDGLEEEGKEETRRDKRNYFYASEASECIRRLYMKFFPEEYVPSDIHGRVYLIFKVGDEIHEQLVKYLSRKGLVESVEKELKLFLAENVEVHGRMDAVLKKGVPLEIKSIAEWGFVKLVKDDAPKMDNVKQLMVYLHATKKPYGYLLYMNKNNSKLKEFKVEYDENIAKEIVDLFVTAKKAIDEKNIPTVPKGMVKSRYPCSFCQLRQYCFKK